MPLKPELLYDDKSTYSLNRQAGRGSSITRWLCRQTEAEITEQERLVRKEHGAGPTKLRHDHRATFLAPRRPVFLPQVDMTEKDPELQRRYRRLFWFYDRQGDGVINMEGDFRKAAETLAARWQNRSAPFPNILELLIATYQHETERRDLNHDGVVNEQEFVDSHGQVVSAFARLPDQARAFIAKAAGGFFDCLDLNGDGLLELSDLEAYAAAYGKPTAGIPANLARMLAPFQLPPDRLPKAVFLELVTQYWFDPSPDAPGRWLFDLEFGVDPHP